MLSGLHICAPAFPANARRSTCRSGNLIAQGSVDSLYSSLFEQRQTYARMGNFHVLLVALQLVMLSHLAAAAGDSRHRYTSPRDLVCNSDMQIVMCGQIPLAAAAERRACCRMFRPAPVNVSASAVVQEAAAASKALQDKLTLEHRTDLDVANGSLAAPLDWLYSSNCTQSAKVDVPVFLQGGEVRITQQTVPQLDRTTIQKVKAAAMAKALPEIQQQHARLRSADSGSGFVHPGNCVGAAELATMQHRVFNQVQPQLAAKDVLLTGAWGAA